MALSAQQVIKTYDYYNSLTLVPGYVATGYEQEQYIAKAQYSTDFSSNPIGSKVDFFTHLNDPCISIVAPHPVFTIPKPLSALDPQWFNGYWDEAMFYSHPLVKEQISANAPDVYQDFSDSVGTLTYTPNDFDPGNPGAYGHDAFNSGLLGKIPSRLSNQVNKLNGDMFKLYEKFSPAGLGLDKNTFVSQVFAHQSSTYTLQAGIATRFGSLKIKLPFNTNMTGNLIDPVAWTQKNVIEGVNTAVDKINGVIKTPGRLLSEGLTKLKSLLPKITLPSLSKLLGLNVPDSNISNVLASLQTYGNAVKSILSTAQGVITAAQQTQQAIQQGIGSVAGTINQETGKLVNVVDTVNRLPATVQGINSVVNVGGTTAGMTYQTPNAITGLNKNSVVIIPGNTINSQGNDSVVKVVTNQYPVT